MSANTSDSTTNGPATDRHDDGYEERVPYDNLAIARMLHGFGIPLVPYEPGTKRARRSKPFDLENLVTTGEEVEAAFASRDSVGVSVGHKTPRYFVDVEADDPVALRTRPFADLPETPLRSGRESKPDSRWIYETDSPIEKRITAATHRSGALCELNVGNRASIFTGLHASGESYRPTSLGPPALVSSEDLVKAASRWAAMTLLATGMIPGIRDGAFGAIGASLARLGWDDAQIERFVLGVCAGSEDEEVEHRVDYALRSAVKVRNGENVTGWQTLTDLLNDPRLIRKVRQFLGDDGRSPINLELSHTDTGNAKRFVQYFGDIVLNDPVEDTFYIWSSTHWKRDNQRRVYEFANQAVHKYVEEAQATLTGRSLQEALRFAAMSLNSSRIEGAVREAARSLPDLKVTPDDLDAQPFALNVGNGTINLRTGELLAHNRDDLLTRVVDVQYDPAATCPVFLATLERAFDGNQLLTDYFQRAVGYSLVGAVIDKVVFIAWGPTNRAKTTLLGKALQRMLGDYAIEVPHETVLAVRNESIPTGKAALKGKRFAVVSEPARGAVLDVAFIKNASGGNRQTGRFLYKNTFEYDPSATFWVDTNHKPVISDSDDSIWQRLKVIPFTGQMPIRPGDEGYIDNFEDVLQAEFPGILAWAIAGCLEWQRQGLDEPDIVRNAVKEYREEEDRLSGFIEDCLIVEPEGRVPVAAVWKMYTDWAHRDRSRLSRREFNELMEARGFGRRTTRLDDRTLKAWHGIKPAASPMAEVIFQPIGNN